MWVDFPLIGGMSRQEFGGKRAVRRSAASGINQPWYKEKKWRQLDHLGMVKLLRNLSLQCYKKCLDIFCGPIVHQWVSLLRAQSTFLYFSLYTWHTVTNHDISINQIFFFLYDSLESWKRPKIPVLWLHNASSLPCL